MADFFDVIKKWTEDTETRINDTLQTIAIQVGKSVIMLSPVDTGRFRGNWQLTIDSPATSSLVNYDQSGGATIQDLVAKASLFTAGQVAYIQNHVLYGHDLEWGTYNGPTQKVTDEGFSTQAPAGMVRVTEQQFMRIVNDAVRLHKEG